MLSSAAIKDIDVGSQTESVTASAMALARDRKALDERIATSHSAQEGAEFIRERANL